MGSAKGWMSRRVRTVWWIGSLLTVVAVSADPPEGHLRRTSACPECCDEPATNAPAVEVPVVRLKFEPRTSWLEASERRKSLPLDARVTTQDGVTFELGRLIGRPLAMSFVYTRCDNPYKCARVATTLAGLQRELERMGWTGRVRLCLVSYDPEYDTPARLTEYAARMGYGLGNESLVLQLDSRDRDRFFKELEVAVNFNASGVNIHGIQLMLFDRAGRLARVYHTLIWDNRLVLEDLERLSGEREAGLSEEP